MILRVQYRKIFYPMLGALIAGWFYTYFWFGDLDVFNNTFSLMLHAANALIAMVLIFQILDESQPLWHRPAFIIGLAVIGASLIDALFSMVLMSGDALGHWFPLGVGITRNLAWVVAYAALGYSFILPARSDSKYPGKAMNRRRDDPKDYNLHGRIDWREVPR